EPAGQRAQRQVLLGRGEHPVPQRGRPLQRLAEALDVDDVDADSDDHHSTVTDLARLRGWSTSWPSLVAKEHAKICSGTVATSGCSSVGTLGSQITCEAYAVRSSSPC